MTLVEAINKYMKDSGLSQNQFAKSIGVHTSAISKLLCGRRQPSMELLRHLAQIESLKQSALEYIISRLQHD